MISATATTPLRGAIRFDSSANPRELRRATGARHDHSGHWTYASAAEMAAALATKTVSPRASPKPPSPASRPSTRDINAVCMRFRRARGRPEADAGSRESAGPLLGVPMTIKERSINLEGTPDHLGLCRGRGLARRGRPGGPTSRPQAPSASARPMCRSHSATGRATTTSTASTTNPLRSRALARRLVRRLLRRAGGWLRPLSPRSDRPAPCPRTFLRRFRPQADPRSRSAGGSLLARARPAGLDRSVGDRADGPLRG